MHLQPAIKSPAGEAGIDFQHFDLTKICLKSGNTIPTTVEPSTGFSGRSDPGMQEQIRNSDLRALPEIAWHRFTTEGIAQFLDRHGHLSDSGGDFGSVPWRETPD